MLKKYDKILYEVLIDKTSATKESLEPIIKKVEDSGQGFKQVLIDEGLFIEKNILVLLAEKLGFEYYNLREIIPEEEVLSKVPVKIASYYNFLPLNIKERILTVAVNYPLDIMIQDEIRTQLGYNIKIGLSCSRDILEGLNKFYGVATQTLEGIDSDKSQKKELPSGDNSEDVVEDIGKLAGAASVINLVNQIIIDGWKKRASDIHIEPYRDKSFIRYRIDGLLYDTHVSDKMSKFLKPIVSRIKIMSSLNIVERRLPQDGRAVVKVQGEILDLRISTMPTPFGESLVMRILPTKRLLGLEKLGLSTKNLQTLMSVIRKPNGIIFVTGPTGSGKTTTLYSCLNEINTKVRKIITIEDPIEYETTGITQMQVMPQIGLTFSQGLRSILRHDPDVIMLGEIRDLETAEIAIRIALTGHLMFSTLHTNDAAGGITRLIDIGVEPYLVASSSEAFIAQRLIRVLCLECKYEDKTVSQEIREMISKDLGIGLESFSIFNAKGCEHCNFTGFVGRQAIYEILVLDEEIKNLIIKRTPSSQIKSAAVSKGMTVLRQDGWQKVIAGLATVEEVMQITAPLENGSKKTFYNEPQSGKIIFSGLSQRAYNRLDDKINFTYEVYKTKEGLLRGEVNSKDTGTTKNISAGGLIFVSGEFLSMEYILSIKISFPDGGDYIQCLAKIVKITEIIPNKAYEVALCFLDIASTQRARIDKYVARKS